MGIRMGALCQIYVVERQAPETFLFSCALRGVRRRLVMIVHGGGGVGVCVCIYNPSIWLACCC